MLCNWCLEFIYLFSWAHYFVWELKKCYSITMLRTRSNKDWKVELRPKGDSTKTDGLGFLFRPSPVPHDVHGVPGGRAHVGPPHEEGSQNTAEAGANIIKHFFPYVTDAANAAKISCSVCRRLVFWLVQSGKPYWTGRLCTVDLLVLLLVQLFPCCVIYFL
jgi:hypothetical protein